MKAKRAAKRNGGGTGRRIPGAVEPRLLTHYRGVARPALREQFGFANPHQIPQVVKVTLNVGVGEGSRDRKLVESVAGELAVISGQKAVITRARRSISNFRLREGMPVGATVTLRRRGMWEFLDRFVSVAVPRIRDFRGLNTRSFDGRGNYTVGIREQIIFPEVDYDKVRQIHGMDVTVVTSTDKDDQAYALLRQLGFPFRGEIPVIIGARTS
ncbi:MAG: 50S ribosomal protein L5 [Gemmatimonadota bacterium]|nr:50S ribosomal protein L5 [Gemmatimonadota bacterium]